MLNGKKSLYSNKSENTQSPGKYEFTVITSWNKQNSSKDDR